MSNLRLVYGFALLAQSVECINLCHLTILGLISQESRGKAKNLFRRELQKNNYLALNTWLKIKINKGT